MEIKRDFYLNKLVEWIIRGVAVKGRAVAFFCRCYKKSSELA